MRKHYLFMLMILVAILLVACSNYAEQISAQDATKEVKVGNIISFGNHDWRILAVYDDNTALIIAENVIERRRFHNVWEAVTWEESDMRLYLNDVFLGTFTQEERSQILPSIVSTPDNYWYRIRGGGDTTDYIFLLSIEEVVKYFDGDSEAWSPSPLSYSVRQWLIDDEYNSSRIAYDDEIAASWWLRSPGFDIDFIAIVMEDGSIAISGTGGGVDSLYIRPALLLNLD